jgi:YtkA-like protein
MQGIRTPGIAVMCVAAFCSLASAACQDSESRMTEIQRTQAGALTVVLLSPHDALRHGEDRCDVEFRSPDGRLTDVGEAKATATMPMPGAPMLGSIDVSRTNIPGRYTARTHLGMAGTWRLSLQWNGPAGSGSFTFSVKAQ